MPWEWCPTLAQNRQSPAHRVWPHLDSAAPGAVSATPPIPISENRCLCRTYFISEIISEQFLKIFVSLISEICRMLYNFRWVCMHIISDPRISFLVSSSQGRGPKLLAVKGSGQPHTDNKWKSNHWNSVLLVKIPSSSYLITWGKDAVNFGGYRNPSHHSYDPFIVQMYVLPLDVHLYFRVCVRAHATGTLVWESI